MKLDVIEQWATTLLYGCLVDNINSYSTICKRIPKMTDKVCGKDIVWRDNTLPLASITQTLTIPYQDICNKSDSAGGQYLTAQFQSFANNCASNFDRMIVTGANQATDSPRFKSINSIFDEPILYGREVTPRKHMSVTNIAEIERSLRDNNVELLITSCDMFKKIKSYLMETQHNIDFLNIGEGVKAISFHGVPVINNPDVLFNTCYGITPDWEIQQLCNWRYLVSNDDRIIRVLDKNGKPDKIIFTLVKYCNLICTNVDEQFKYVLTQ